MSALREIVEVVVAAVLLVILLAGWMGGLYSYQVSVLAMFGSLVAICAAIGWRYHRRQ